MPDPESRRYSITLGAVPSGGFTARCYDDESGEHVWSSENASTVDLALGEIGREITRDLARGVLDNAR